MCSSLQSITIPSSVTVIGIRAFEYCSSLQSVTIPSSVTTIGEYAFFWCSSLHSVIIPSSVTEIGACAFSNGDTNIFTSDTKKIIWLGNTPPEGYLEATQYYNSSKRKYYYTPSINYVSSDGYSFSSYKSQTKYVYEHLSSMFEIDGAIYVPVTPSERTCDVIDSRYDGELHDISILDKVTYRNIEMTVNKVMPFAFIKNRTVANVKLAYGGNVEEYTFNQCPNLISVDAANQGYIGEAAFSGCKALQSVTASNQGYIGEYAFSGCTALQSLKASNNGYIGDCAFKGCTGNNWSAKLTNRGYIGAEAFSGCSDLTTAEIDAVGVIGWSAFDGCSGLKSVAIGSEVTSLGFDAFSDCSSLTSVVIPDNVTSVGSSAFADCNSLKSISVGRGLKTIPKNFLSGCKSLSSIIIPGNIASISDYVFKGCTSLGDVTFEKTVDDDERLSELTLGSNGSSSLFSSCPLDEVYIGRRLVYNTGSDYGYSPFYRNTSLRSVEIADAETQIYDNEFYGCSNLQSLKIGDGVTAIGKYAFSGCSALEEFSAGAAVESIGEDAFSDCTAMKNYYSFSAVPPTCGSQALDDINKWECVLHVPAESLDAYKAAPQWKEFFFIKGAGAVEGVAADADSSVAFEVSAGTLVISGATDKAVTIYGVDGSLRARYDSYAGQSIKLPRGVYVVRVAGMDARKVSI